MAVSRNRGQTPVGTEIGRLEDDRGVGAALAILSDNIVATTGQENSIRLWSPTTRGTIARLTGHTREVTAVLGLSDGRLASGSADRTVRLWDTQSGREIATLQGHQDEVISLAELPDGRLASGSADTTIYIWDLVAPGPTTHLEGHHGPVTALAVLSDGRLASGSADSTLRLWDTETGREIARIDGQAGSITALAILTDGHLVSASTDKSIRLWDPTSGLETARLLGHSDTVTALAVLPNGQLASASADRTIRLWDTRTGTNIARLEGSTAPIRTLAAFPNGTIVSGSIDAVFRLWDPKTAKLPEPSMEEILASIRKIISEEPTDPPTTIPPPQGVDTSGSEERQSPAINHSELADLISTSEPDNLGAANAHSQSSLPRFSWLKVRSEPAAATSSAATAKPGPTIALAPQIKIPDRPPAMASAVTAANGEIVTPAPSEIPGQPLFAINGKAVRRSSGARPPAAAAQTSAPVIPAAPPSPNLAGMATEDLPPNPSGSATEERLAELFRPLVRQYLDHNLPRILERAIKTELDGLELKSPEKPQRHEQSTVIIEPIRDIVECSVFAPARVAANSRFAVQVHLHLFKDIAKVFKEAVRLDPTTNRQAFESLARPIARGSNIELFLVCPSLPIERPWRQLVWTGDPASELFEAMAPVDHRDRPIVATVYFSLDEVPIGDIEFEITIEPVNPTAAMPHRIMPLGFVGVAPHSLDQFSSTVATSYESAFVSYARQDIKEVSLFAEGLRRSGVSLAFDLTELEPGDDWAAKLPQLISAADVFFLIWSDNAARSLWVDKEAQHAVALYESSLEKLPRIVPITLHRPSPMPPNYLQKFHFDSPWLAIRTAQQFPLFHQEQ